MSASVCSRLEWIVYLPWMRRNCRRLERTLGQRGVECRAADVDWSWRHRPPASSRHAPAALAHAQTLRLHTSQAAATQSHIADVALEFATKFQRKVRLFYRHSNFLKTRCTISRGKLVRKNSRFMQPFRHDTGVWQTDRQTHSPYLTRP